MGTIQVIGVAGSYYSSNRREPWPGVRLDPLAGAAVRLRASEQAGGCGVGGEVGGASPRIRSHHPRRESSRQRSASKAENLEASAAAIPPGPAATFQDPLPFIHRRRRLIDDRDEERDHQSVTVVHDPSYHRLRD